MEQLIQEIQALEAKLSTFRSQLRSHNDGFVYLTCIRCYGSLNYKTYTNKFFVQEICDEYNGDNGIVDIYTTNSNHGILTYGDVYVMSLEDMQNISQNNISMSRAVTNWITGAI